LKRSGTQHGPRKWYAAASLPVQLRIARNVGVHLDEVAIDRRNGTAKLETHQLTVRKRLHREFSFDPSCHLHDLAKSWENIVILKEVN
jgi:hypothetical protein